jgi:uncharacterized protein YyaL (SSP411 family)
LEDYALVSEAFISLFECTGQKQWLEDAARLTGITLTDFYDEDKMIFSFTAADQTDLVTKTYEVHDNVIPASNSVMARNLYRLSWLLDRTDYREIAASMLNGVAEHMTAYPTGYSNWAQLVMDLSEDHLEVAITGPEALNMLHDLQRYYLPQVTFCAAMEENNLPLLQGRFVRDKTLIYICRNNTCQLPVDSVESALELIGQLSEIKIII